MLRQSLAQFQAEPAHPSTRSTTSSRSAADIAGVPKGCLIGLDAGDELLEDYRRVIGRCTRPPSKAAGRLEQADSRAASGRRPPHGVKSTGRRCASSSAMPGRASCSTTARSGWGIFVARTESEGGVGLVIFGDDLVHVSNYRHVVFVSEHVRAEVPEELVTEILAEQSTVRSKSSARSARNFRARHFPMSLPKWRNMKRARKH